MGNLVLSREVGERIYMDVKGIEIELCIVRVSRGQVAIAIRAPKDVIIHRDDCRKTGISGIRK